MNTLDKLKDEKDEWMILQQSIPLTYYLTNLSGMKGSIYRKISNSRRQFRNISNKYFFRNTFSDGFYRSVISQNSFIFLFFIKIRRGISKEKIRTETKLRMKKILFSEIIELEVDDLSLEDQILLSEKNGHQFYQKVLNTYFNIR